MLTNKIMRFIWNFYFIYNNINLILKSLLKILMYKKFYDRMKPKKMGTIDEFNILV